MRHSRILLALMLSVCGAAPPWAQEQKSVNVPAEQRALTDILSKYNALDQEAANDIQRKKVHPAFKKEFCAKIPQGSVSGWVGEVYSLDDNSPAKGINLSLSVSTEDLYPGAFGVGLWLGTDVVSEDSTQPHSPTIIPAGSPLYQVVSNLRDGDTVVFDGTFMPYVSQQACYDNDSNEIASFSFSSIRRIGWGLELH